MSTQKRRPQIEGIATQKCFLLCLQMCQQKRRPQIEGIATNNFAFIQINLPIVEKKTSNRRDCDLNKKARLYGGLMQKRRPQIEGIATRLQKNLQETSRYRQKRRPQIEGIATLHFFVKYATPLMQKRRPQIEGIATYLPQNMTCICINRRKEDLKQKGLRHTCIRNMDKE